MFQPQYASMGAPKIAEGKVPPSVRFLSYAEDSESGNQKMQSLRLPTRTKINRNETGFHPLVYR